MVWGLELLTAFNCPGVDVLFPQTLKQNQERNEGKERAERRCKQECRQQAACPQQALNTGEVIPWVTFFILVTLIVV